MQEKITQFLNLQSKSTNSYALINPQPQKGEHWRGSCARILGMSVDIFLTSLEIFGLDFWDLSGPLGKTYTFDSQNI